MHNHLDIVETDLDLYELSSFWTYNTTFVVMQRNALVHPIFVSSQDVLGYLKCFRFWIGFLGIGAWDFGFGF